MEYKDLAKMRKIHEGRFSLIYIAEISGQQVVVKQLHPRIAKSITDQNRFIKEAETYKLFDDDPCELIISEHGYFQIRKYYPGLTLKELNAKYNRRKYHLLFTEVYREIIDQLIVFHDRGFVHCDIKPSNILVWDFNKNPKVKLLDYGLAINASSKPVRSQSNPLPFSMIYSAPELMLNEPEFISELTDLYSLGICMVESFSGKPVYDAQHPAILLQMMLALPIKKNKKIPEIIFNAIQIISAKPTFKKPIAHYTIEEVKKILVENLTQRETIGNANALLKLIQ